MMCVVISDRLSGPWVQSSGLPQMLSLQHQDSVDTLSSMAPNQLNEGEEEGGPRYWYFSQVLQEIVMYSRI